MRQILILKDLALNAKIGGGVIANQNEINLLQPGALAMFTDGGVLVTTANAASTVFNDVKHIRYVLGGVDSAEGGTWTLPIPREGLNYTAKTYVAPVKEVQFIGNDAVTGALNLPATLIAGTVANIRIIKNGQGLEFSDSKFRYEAYVTSSSTNATILADLIGKINSDVTSPVVAVLVGASVGISLTSKEFGETFEIGLDGIIKDATVIKDGTSNSVAVGYGVGTPTQVADLEEEFSAELGKTNKTHLVGKYYSKAPKVDPAVTYDMYTLDWAVARKGTIGSQFATNQELIIAMPDGATLQSDFENIHSILHSNSQNVEPGSDAA